MRLHYCCTTFVLTIAGELALCKNNIWTPRSSSTNRREMKAQGSAKVSSSGGYSIVPPPSFSYVEENICRCTYPVTRANISFAQSINIGYIVNVSARKIDPAFQTYCDERTIEIVSGAVTKILRARLKVCSCYRTTYFKKANLRRLIKWLR